MKNVLLAGMLLAASLQAIASPSPMITVLCKKHASMRVSTCHEKHASGSLTRASRAAAPGKRMSAPRKAKGGNGLG